MENHSYDGGDIPLTELIEPIKDSDWSKKLCAGLFGNAETLGDVYRQYDAAVYRVDREVGRLIHQLKATNEFKNTAVIVTADHGESLIEHDIFFDHHGLYDPSLHVPLVINCPGFDGEETRFVQHYDLVPTILEILGKEYDQDRFDGIPLVTDGVSNDRLDDRDAIYAEEAHTARRRCIRTDSFKYIKRLDDREQCRYCDITHGAEEELYDIETDPGETENIVDEHPQIAARLGESLNSWIEELPDPQKGEVEFGEDPEVIQRLDDMGYV